MAQSSSTVGSTSSASAEAQAKRFYDQKQGDLWRPPVPPDVQQQQQRIIAERIAQLSVAPLAATASLSVSSSVSTETKQIVSASSSSDLSSSSQTASS